ncbi:unnamed protein product, partial [Allacma fusca]
MASPDTKEIELISQLRGKVSDLNLETKFNTDHFLLRWIRARQHNVELAEKMLREHMIYREENDLEKILSWTPPEILLKTFPVHFLGYDDDNCPVHLFITIVDQKGLSYRSVCSVGAMDLNMQMTKRFEANYPETMKTVFEINCNAVFAAIFSLVQFQETISGTVNLALNLRLHILVGCSCVLTQLSSVVFEVQQEFVYKMASPNTKEIELIPQFRAKVSDLNLESQFTTDHFLLRWIRARQHNLDLAEKMLREHIKYREENDLENILSWSPPEIFVQTLPFRFLGYDEDNSPVSVVSYDKFDLKQILELGEGHNYLKYMDYLFAVTLDRMEGKFTREGYPVTQFVCIEDRKGMSYRKLASLGAMDLELQMSRLVEANYPETMKIAFEINCNSVFAA